MQGALLTATVASPTDLIAGTSAVPEPTAVSLLGVVLGVATVGLLRRRRFKV